MQTERLIIRPFTLDDAEAYLPLVSDPDVIRYTGEEPQTSVEAARGILAARPLRDYALHGFGRMACIEKRSGRLIGFSGLKFLEELQEVDIGYRFLPAYWGKGYATESAHAIMRHGTEERGISRIIGLVQPENAASANVLLKLGLGFERHVCLSGIDLDLYATVRAA
jgi:RimJ/RimL family protein N-acetyltransferase